MRTLCIKTRIKEGHIDDVRKWFEILKERKDEVFETLYNEGVLVESAFIDKQGIDYFLIYYLKANDIDTAYKVFNDSTSDIDLYYKFCWKKYCEGRFVLEELLDFDTFCLSKEKTGQD